MVYGFSKEAESSYAVMALSISLVFSLLLLCMEVGLVNHKCLFKRSGREAK